MNANNTWDVSLYLNYVWFFYVFILCILVGNVFALRVRGINHPINGPCSNLMIPINKISAVLLLLLPIRERVTLWAILCQAITIINAAIYLLFHDVPWLEPKACVIFMKVYFSLWVCLLIDGMIGEYRKSKR
jgi:hypothetical protein